MAVATSQREGMLQIGQVAERVELSLRSVRFYEEEGLLEPESRTEGGFRLYTEAQVERLLLIKQMKPIGFTVEQMRGLLDAYDLLEDPGIAGAEKVRAREEISRFAVLASERCDLLRERLARAEEFVGRLQG